MNLHYDQVGTLRVVANRYGSVVKELLYDSFGILLEDDEPDMRKKGTGEKGDRLLFATVSTDKPHLVKLHGNK